MFSYLLNVIPPMLLGVQSILLVILLEGEICPGQRGRLHKQLLTLAILWLVASTLYWPFAVVGIILLLFFSQVKVSKTRDSGPLWMLYIALGFALAFNVIMILASLLPQRFFIIVSAIFLGASLTHVLLIFARTRLQAFHRILPVTGIVSAMLMSLTVLWQIQGYNPGYLSQNIWAFVSCFILMLAGVIISSWHIFTQQTIGKLLPCCGFALNLIALGGFAKLLY